MSDGQVLAPQATRVLAVVLLAVPVIGTVWLLLTAPGELLTTAPFLMLFCLAVYATCWRPCVVVFRDRVLLRNVFRDVTVPFGALDDVTTRYGLTLHCGSRRFQAWGAPAPGALLGRPTPVSGAAARVTAHPMPDGSSPLARASTALGTPSGAFALMVRNAWEAWQSQRDQDAAVQITVRPLWWLIAAFPVLIVCCWLVLH